MNPGLMIGVAFVVAMLAVVYLQLADIKKARRSWAATPTLPDYITQHPECQTDAGITCRECNSGNINEKGLANERDARRTFTCGRCEAVLYRSV
jgi:uncharacterized paraquat-inducible protein A